MLFNKSQELFNSKKTIEKRTMSLWNDKAGYLALYSRLIVDKYQKEQELKFDAGLEFAMKRMEQMNEQIKQKDWEIAYMKKKLSKILCLHLYIQK